MARDARGAPCAPRDLDAACWCLDGAVIASVVPIDLEIQVRNYLRARVPKGFENLWDFNDRSTTDVVITWLNNRILELVLIAALKNIEKGWCKGFFAKDSCGEDTPAYAPNAVRWCADGAIERAAWDLGQQTAEDARDLFRKANNLEGIWLFNDGQPNSDNIIKAFGKAIKHVRSL